MHGRRARLLLVKYGQQANLKLTQPTVSRRAAYPLLAGPSPRGYLK